jgi:hypothetical protein
VVHRHSRLRTARHRQLALDLCRFAPRMRAPMHPNYFNASVAAALPQGPILSNRLCAPACASPEAGDFDVLMR